MEWAELRDFVAVARAGSFVGAANETGIPKATISRHVQSLEEALRLRLFERTTRTVRLTDDGAVLLERAARLLADASELRRQMIDRSGEPVGMLRVAVPAMLGLEFIGSASAKLRQRWPDLSLEVVFTDRRVDLLEENFDCAIRAGAMPDAAMVARKISAFRNILVTTPELAAQLEELRSPAELKDQPTISFSAHGSVTPWSMRSGSEFFEIEPRSQIILGSYRAAAQAAAQGGGIAFVPDMVAEQEFAAGLLCQILPECHGEETAICVVYPAHRRPSVKVRAFADLLSELLSRRRM